MHKANVNQETQRAKRIRLWILEEAHKKKSLICEAFPLNWWILHSEIVLAYSPMSLQRYRVCFPTNP